MNPTAEARPVLDPLFAPPFPQAALPVLRNPQLRKNVAHAIDVIQAKRAKLVAEKTDWQELRTAASAIRMHVLENLGAYLEQFEARCTAAPEPPPHTSTSRAVTPVGTVNVPDVVIVCTPCGTAAINALIESRT